jgi:hypothetical protein
VEKRTNQHNTWVQGRLSTHVRTRRVLRRRRRAHRIGHRQRPTERENANKNALARYPRTVQHAFLISTRSDIYASVGQRQLLSSYQFRYIIITPRLQDSMASTERPRLPEASLTPRAFGCSAAEMDNAERRLRYLNQCVQYRNLRDEEALTLFKLLLTDQTQDWSYALPEDQSDSFHRLQDAFMKRYTPNTIQRYQKASHMWARVQQPEESSDSYITAIKTVAKPNTATGRTTTVLLHYPQIKACDPLTCSAE